MKKLILLLCCLLFVGSAFAQIAYLQYRHVTNENEAKFLERETEHWSKVAKAAIDKGQMTSWTLWKKVGVLSSEDESPNYVFVNGFADLAQLDGNPWGDNMGALGDVKPEDIETNSLSTVTFDYYVQNEGFIEGDYKYALVNYAKPVDRGAFIAENLSLWKPFHETNIKNGGGMTAWGMSSVVYPSGNQDRFSVFTFDGFNKMSDVMEYMRYSAPDPTVTGPGTEIFSKSKMSEILPKGFEYSILYERIKTVTK